MRISFYRLKNRLRDFKEITQIWNSNSELTLHPRLHTTAYKPFPHTAAINSFIRNRRVRFLRTKMFKQLSQVTEPVSSKARDTPPSKSNALSAPANCFSAGLRLFHLKDVATDDCSSSYSPPPCQPVTSPGQNTSPHTPFFLPQPLIYILCS